MARIRSAHPTEVELMILQIIWRVGPSTVRDVCDALSDTHQLAFTSVITTMNVMVSKGYLEAERRSRKEGGTIYRARIARGVTARTMLQSLAKRLFGGSLVTAINYLLSEGEFDKKEMEDLRALVNRHQKDQKP